MVGSTAGDESPIQFGMETLSYLAATVISGGTSVYPTDIEMSLYYIYHGGTIAEEIARRMVSQLT